MKRKRVLDFKVRDKNVKLSVFKYKRPKFKSLNSKFYKNDEIYANWILNLIKQASETSLEEGQKYNALSVFMNSNNIEKLNEVLTPMTWLNISPVVCEELKDNEVAIDLSDVIAEE